MTSEEIKLRRLIGQHLLAPADEKLISETASCLWSDLKQKELEGPMYRTVRKVVGRFARI